MIKKQYEHLLDDLKLLSKAIKIVRDENNPENRKFACGLVEDLVNRIFQDLLEVYERDVRPLDGKVL